MTPLISEMVSLSPDAEKYHWFDLGNLPNKVAVKVNEDIVITPYLDQVIVARDYLGTKIMLRIIKRDDALITGGIFIDQKITDIPPLIFTYKKDGLHVQDERGKPKDRNSYMSALGLIHTFISRLKTETVAYLPKVKPSLINKKRAAKGKGPLLFDWHTVVVQPVVQKMPHQGGTHASPRLHDRRGHWRTMKQSGKRVWVRDCKVGDASKGVVFKDYRVVGANA